MIFFGDKSISHRALMLASLCNGQSIIKNISKGNDVFSTIECLKLCGIKIEFLNEEILVNGGTLSQPKQELNCYNSGTTARLLLGLLAGQKISATIIGDSSLSSRPMERVTIPLGLMGADIKNNNGKLPLKIETRYLIGIDYFQKVSSAQVKSALLFAGLGASGTTKISEEYLSRDHTEIMMKFLGIDIIQDNNSVLIKNNNLKLNSFEISIPGDPSTASFFAAAALLLNKEIILKNILLNPTRIGFFKLIEKMGAKIKYLNVKKSFGEKVGDIKVYPSNLKSIKISESMIPSIIDELPIISILASHADGTTVLSGAKELRYKECDRIYAICYNLKNMGVKVKERPDGFIISKFDQFVGTDIKTFNDHRIAMAFSIAGLVSDGKNNLDNMDCVKISCPNFFNLLEDLIY
tara:strand:- start:374 stop:1600 length:1227 start_codon:yes stop_codon:yes gene_type:complete